MSTTDQTQKNRTTAAGRLDLSPTKVMGGALAAMTAAALGAQLSVVGTVIGAAMASVIAAVAGAIYTTSIEHTGNRVRRVWRRSDAPSATPAADSEPVDTATEAESEPIRRRLSWSSVLVGALAAFGLAAAALTGIELVTGQAISGGDGTTVSQVSGSDNRPSKPADDPSPSPEPTASSEPTSSPTVETSPIAPTTAASETEPTVTPRPTVPTESETVTATETAPSPTPRSAESQTASSAP